MIKAITFIKRKPGMSVEAFQEYWRTRHAEVVAGLPGVRRYVQSHALLSGYARRELVHDGIAEVWFDDVQAMRDLVGTTAYDAVQADEANFIDRASMGMILTDDHVVKDGAAPADAVKNIEFVSRRPDLSVADFQHYWRDVHGPIAAAIPMIRRYVQSHARAGAYRNGKTPKYDGCAITWFDSTDAMRRSAHTLEYARTRADEPNFIPEGEVPLIIAKEHVII